MGRLIVSGCLEGHLSLFSPGDAIVARLPRRVDLQVDVRVTLFAEVTLCEFVVVAAAGEFFGSPV
jgi:hypothetical protein